MRTLPLMFMGFLLALDLHAASRCRAIDGDTIRCGGERIRLQGVYAVERNDIGGRRAQENLQRKLDAGKVRIVRRGKDSYGRTIGDVYVGGRKITQSDVGKKGGRGLTHESGKGQGAVTSRNRGSSASSRGSSGARGYSAGRSSSGGRNSHSGGRSNGGRRRG
ncbi:MAG: thermonuclease family protein [Burkholderiales bacterium]|nr:thermonuclease family protein [Burkholderiales bacterium]